jgi:hypothetical protein
VAEPLAIVLAFYWGISTGVTFGIIAGQQNRLPRLSDWIAMYTVGPLVLAYAAAMRLWLWRKGVL